MAPAGWRWPDAPTDLLDKTVRTVDVRAFQIRGMSTTDGAFLGVRHLPGSKEAAIAGYRRHLERHLGERLDDDAWATHMDIALLAGLLMAAPIKAYRAAHAEDVLDRELERQDLPWWSLHARQGARQLAL